MKKLLAIAATLVVAFVAGCAKQAPAPQAPAMDNAPAVNYKGKPTPMYKVQQMPEQRPSK